MAHLAESAPALLAGEASAGAALIALRNALNIPEGGSVNVATPIEKVLISDTSLPHVIEK